MIVISALVGCYLLSKHLQRVESNVRSEGLTTGLVWLALNWLLVFVILVPFAKMETGYYVESIGLRYLQIPIIAFFMGSMVDMKTTIK